MSQLDKNDSYFDRQKLQAITMLSKINTFERGLSRGPSMCLFLCVGDKNDSYFDRQKLQAITMLSKINTFERGLSRGLSSLCLFHVWAIKTDGPTVLRAHDQI